VRFVDQFLMRTKVTTARFSRIAADSQQETPPTWMGYSIGTWEGDTFVVDSIGFNDQTFIDAGGHPHTEAYHTTERFRRRDFGHVDYEITIDDPKAYTKPWKVTIPFELFPDNELMEAVCENEKDSTRLVGK